MDDIRAFCSIPARHEVWQRASANWLAGLVVRHIVDMDDASEMIQELTVGLARRAYKARRGWLLAAGERASRPVGGRPRRD